MFKKANAEASRLYRKYKEVPDRCKITPNEANGKLAEISGDPNKNLVLAFLHGFYNQVLMSIGRDDYRNLDGTMVTIRPGRYNSLTKLKDIMVYMEISDIMGRIQANGLINVTEPKVLKEIAPKFLELSE
jgi:hypothetical protein